MSLSAQTFQRTSLPKRVAGIPGTNGRIRGTPDIGRLG